MKHIFFFCLISFFYSSFSYGEVLRSVSDPWCPYVCGPEEAEGRKGFFVEALIEAFKRKNIDVNFVIVPYTRCLADTKKGKYDALVGINTEGKPELLFSLPLAKTQSCFFVREKSLWKYEGVKSLPQIRLGAVQEYNYGQAITEYITENKDDPKKIQILPTSTNLEQNIKKLLSNRVDAIVDDRHVIEWYLKKNQLKNKLKLAGCIQERDLVIGFPKVNKKRSEHFLEIFNTELKKMIKSGELEKMKANYR